MQDHLRFTNMSNKKIKKILKSKWIDALKQLCWQFGRKTRESDKGCQRRSGGVVEAWQTSCRGVAKKLFKVGRKVASVMQQHVICSLCLFYAVPFHLFIHSEIIMKTKMLASTQAGVTNSEKTSPAEAKQNILECELHLAKAWKGSLCSTNHNRQGWSLSHGVSARGYKQIKFPQQPTRSFKYSDYRKRCCMLTLLNCSFQKYLEGILWSCWLLWRKGCRHEYMNDTIHILPITILLICRWWNSKAPVKLGKKRASGKYINVRIKTMLASHLLSSCKEKWIFTP